MKIMMFGGSFDPVHIGHMIVANELYQHFKPDQFLFVPAGFSPLKETGPKASNEDRTHMLNLVIEKLGFGEVLEYELAQDGKSYTVNTVNHVLTLFPDAEIMFIIGTDQYEQLDRWYEIDKLKAMVTFIVVNRETDLVNTSEEHMLHYFIPRVDVSSTMIRHRLANKEDVTLWVSDEVNMFLKEGGLYEKEESSETR